MIAFICEIVTFLWTIALFVGSIVFLVLVHVKNLDAPSCQRSRWKRPVIFSVVVLFFLLFFNVSSIRYRWHMKVRRDRTRRWFADVARSKIQGALLLKPLRGGQQQGEVAGLEEGVNIPPNPRPERQKPFTRNSSSSQWEYLFVFAQWVATIYLSWCFDKPSMDACGVTHPEVRRGVYILNILQWTYLIFGYCVRALARAYSNRRQRTLMPLRAPETSEVPPFVQEVCFVPSHEQYRDVQLPHPPVELPAEYADCPICYDEFAPPVMNRITRAVLRRNNMNVSAATLWKTRCGHVFHDSCFLEWLKASGGTVCPYCNQDAATAPERPQQQYQPPAGPPPEQQQTEQTEQDGKQSEKYHRKSEEYQQHIERPQVGGIV